MIAFRKKRAKRKRSGLFQTLLLIIQVLLVIATLLAYLSNFVSPAKNSILPFAGLAFPFLLISHAIMVMFWLLVRPKWVLIPLLTIVMGFNITARHVQLNYPDEFEKGEQLLHVCSFNARQYSIWGQDGRASYGVLDTILNFFAAETPDLLCVQEASLKHVVTGNVAEKVRRTLGYGSCISSPYYDGISHGLAIYHHGKVLEQGTLKADGRVIALYADLELRGNIVRVYCVHLQSAKLGSQEYVMDRIAPDAYKDPEFIKGSKQIVRKLRSAYIKRSREAEIIHTHIRECSLPVVLCGDLNDTPCSYVYTTTGKGLKDAFMMAGRGTGRSYHGKFPSFRIDYIFSSKDIRVKSYQTRKRLFSDHHPVFSWLELPGQTI